MITKMIKKGFSVREKIKTNSLLKTKMAHNSKQINNNK